MSLAEPDNNMTDVVNNEREEEALAAVDKTATEDPSPSTPNAPAQQTLPSTSDRSSINSACVACRSKHLKCDGLRICSRCSAQQIPCIYLKSRRGYRGSGRGKNPVNRDSVLHHNNHSPDSNGMADGNEMSLSPFAFPANALSYNFPRSMLTPMGALVPDKAVRLASPDGRNIQRSIDVFYQHFHDSHPFLPPRQHLLQVLKVRPMPHLLTAMSYIASRYIRGEKPAVYAMELESIFQTQPVKDASLVQAMLLYALGLDGAGEQGKAVEILLKAQSVALEIGMNTREYATTHGQDSSIYEESLRRSWHELYVVCVMVAGFHGRRPFYHQSVESSVPLPCETRDYESGSIPQLRTLDDFEEECFVADAIDWSSYTYRISAARNLDRVMLAMHTYSPGNISIDRLEAHLTNWKLHLPESKRACWDAVGNFDEMLFQAHMITEMSVILLHRQYSRLESIAVQNITACSDNTDLVADVDYMHTIKTTQAAARLSKLVSLPIPLIKHTHFFVCALTLSSIVHLSMWSSLPLLSPEQELKEQIRMNAGALKAISNVWPSAYMGFSQVTKAGQMIYATRKDVAGDVFWLNFMQEDIMSGLIEDDPASRGFPSPSTSAPT